jgi:hypothetical protein
LQDIEETKIIQLIIEEYLIQEVVLDKILFGDFMIKLQEDHIMVIEVGYQQQNLNNLNLIGGL